MEQAQLLQLREALKRIFSFPITNITFKELQTTIFTILNQDRDLSNEVLNTLLNGNVQQENKPFLKTLADEFSVQARLSKDILEKGEFINFMSSDLLRQGDLALFTNQLRRLDGETFHFFSDPEGIVRIIEHFIGRLEEIGRVDKSKKFIKEHETNIKKLRERLKGLFS